MSTWGTRSLFFWFHSQRKKATLKSLLETKEEGKRKNNGTLYKVMYSTLAHPRHREITHSTKALGPINSFFLSQSETDKTQMHLHDDYFYPFF